MRRWIASGLVIGATACGPYVEFPVEACQTADLTFVLGADGVTPTTGTVRYAGQIRWENGDTVEHRVQSGVQSDPDAGLLFDTGPLAPNEAWCIEARDSGPHPFFDDLGVSGVLTVESSQAGNDTDTGGDDTSMPY